MSTNNALYTIEHLRRVMAEMLAMELFVCMFRIQIQEILRRAKRNAREGKEFADLRFFAQDNAAFLAAVDGLEVGDVESAFRDMCAPHNIPKVLEFLAELNIAA